MLLEAAGGEVWESISKGWRKAVTDLILKAVDSDIVAEAWSVKVFNPEKTDPYVRARASVRLPKAAADILIAATGKDTPATYRDGTEIKPFPFFAQ